MPLEPVPLVSLMVSTCLPAGPLYGFRETDLSALIHKTRVRTEELGDLFSADTARLGDPTTPLSQDDDYETRSAKADEAIGDTRDGGTEAGRSPSPHPPVPASASAGTVPSTRVCSRQSFDDSLRRAIDQCRQADQTVGLLVAEIENVPLLREACGPEMTDVMLERLATACSEVLRSTDILTRYQTNAFLIMMNHPTEEGLRRVADRIRNRPETKDVRIGDEEIPVNIRIRTAWVVSAAGSEESLAARIVTGAQASDAFGAHRTNGDGGFPVQTVLVLD